MLTSKLKSECEKIEEKYGIPSNIGISAIEHFTKIPIDQEGTTLSQYCEINGGAYTEHNIKRLLKVCSYIELSFKYNLKISGSTSIDSHLWLYSRGNSGLCFHVAPRGFIELYDRSNIYVHTGWVTKSEEDAGTYVYDKSERKLIFNKDAFVKSSNCEISSVDDIAFVFITLEDKQTGRNSTYIGTPKYCFERSFSMTQNKHGASRGSWDTRKPLLYLAMCQKSLMISVAKTLPHIFKDDLSNAEIQSNKDLYTTSFDNLVAVNGGIKHV